MLLFQACERIIPELDTTCFDDFLENGKKPLITAVCGNRGFW
jgi:hypothetical protein